MSKPSQTIRAIVGARAFARALRQEVEDLRGAALIGLQTATNTVADALDAVSVRLRAWRADEKLEARWTEALVETRRRQGYGRQ